MSFYPTEDTYCFCAFAHLFHFSVKEKPACQKPMNTVHLFYWEGWSKIIWKDHYFISWCIRQPFNFKCSLQNIKVDFFSFLVKCTMTNVPILGSKRKPQPQADFSSLKVGKSEARKTKKLCSQVRAGRQIFTEHLLCIGTMLGAGNNMSKKGPCL